VATDILQSRQRSEEWRWVDQQRAQVAAVLAARE
jgi:hypothetical protein